MRKKKRQEMQSRDKLKQFTNSIISQDIITTEPLTPLNKGILKRGLFYLRALYTGVG